MTTAMESPHNNQAAFDTLSTLFGILSHPSRLKILSLLQTNEMDVTQLQKALSISQSSVSQHLNVLKPHGLVDLRKEGNHVFYRLKNPNVIKLLIVAFQMLSMDMLAETEALNACADLLSLWGG